jgi:HPt (histidine-containing phosphotransfer) domain-containing protein
MINWDKVSELREEIGAEDFGEVVEIFLEEVDEAITELGKPGAEGTLETQLHFLKGSALNLGFADFSNRCQAGESAAGNGQEDEVDLPAIIKCYEASKAEFLAALNANEVV